jgi:hypothetical protein
MSFNHTSDQAPHIDVEITSEEQLNHSVRPPSVQSQPNSRPNSHLERYNSSRMAHGQNALPDQLAQNESLQNQRISIEGPLSQNVIYDLKFNTSSESLAEERMNVRDSMQLASHSAFDTLDKENTQKSAENDGNADDNVRTNLGNTKVVMNLLSEMWIIHIAVIIGGTYAMTFLLPQEYSDEELWNYTMWWKLGWIFPLPYTLICFFSLALPFRTTKFLAFEESEARRIDNLYILTVTKGDNREAVIRAWNAHKHLEGFDPCIRVHVLTDEPYYFEQMNCFTCPKSFQTGQSKYKARALEWYRQTMKYTEYDWVLHLDEESVIDDESVRQVLSFIRYEKEYTWGQGVIIYNQYRYWKNWFFTVGDAIRVGDDLARFHLQYDFFHSPTFGAHGSFLLSNGIVENSITWDLGSLTEDYQFATHAWELGFKCGKIPGIVREQSPMDTIGFLKQRRRWYVGIRRLPQLLPKVWWFFWTLGTLSLYFTVASVILGFIIKLQTPRWFGLLKDFSFVNFVYLYILGIFIQDLDKRKNPILIILHIPMTAVLQFFAVILEAMAVMYGLIFPPSDFDVIKK